MQALQEHLCACPYCGESISLLVDCTQIEQSYIEDCSVCCQPILVSLSAGADDTVDLWVRRENE